VVAVVKRTAVAGAVALALVLGFAGGWLAHQPPHPSRSNPVGASRGSPAEQVKVPDVLREPTTRVASIDDALAFIRKRVDERVVLPEGLPAGVALAPEHPVSALRSTTPTGWMLHLVYGTKKHVYIQYGSAVFDGCGPVGARRISVGSVPGLLVASKHPSGWWSELIWPAKPTDTTGRYGLTGSLSPRHTLRMARSMPGTKLKSEATSSC
jgi:hypothetical protein